jgi:hypothetical protein
MVCRTHGFIVDSDAGREKVKVLGVADACIQ